MLTVLSRSSATGTSSPWFETQDCPVALSTYFTRQIQLPIYDHLTDPQIQHMIDSMHDAISAVTR